jgi:glycerophosphoryl diester phosphodiesterase
MCTLSPAQRPLVYAHRGGAALRPENTICSFDNGLALGADGLEFDVHLSRDGAVVVHHDALLDRTTNARGPLAARTAAELAAVDAAHWFRGTDEGREFPFRGQGIGIPTLRDVLVRYPGIPMIIELKVNQPELARRAVEDIRAAGAVDRVSFGSFGWRVLKAARQYEPRIPTGASREEARLALYRSWIRWPAVRGQKYREFQLPERSGSTTIISPRFIEYAHRANLPIYVWTVNEAADIRRLAEWGVDGIISDRPDTAVSVVRELPHRP